MLPTWRLLQVRIVPNAERKRPPTEAGRNFGDHLAVRLDQYFSGERGAPAIGDVERRLARAAQVATDRISRRSFLPDRLELRLLLVAQQTIKVRQRETHQIDRLPHRAEPPVHSVKASR